MQIPETNIDLLLQPLSIKEEPNEVSHLCEGPAWHVDCGFEPDAPDRAIAYTLRHTLFECGLSVFVIGGLKMNGFRQDLQYAARVLIKSPTFTFIAAITLALGIGVNATVFSIANAYLFRPLPVRAPGELMAVATRNQSIEVTIWRQRHRRDDLCRRLSNISARSVRC
jgi:hypothetical protein